MKKLYNYYFPTPSYLIMSATAIDISDQSIKYGEILASSTGPRFSKYGKETIPEGVVVSGKIEKEEEMIRLLRKIKEKEKIQFIRVSLPEEQMYLFTLSLPKTENQNIRDMILLQIEEHIPLKAPDSVFDFDVISENNQTVMVEVVAVAGSLIESYLSVFDRAGLVPISFEIEAQAIARAVIPSGDSKPVMIVDFGNATTGVSISKNGRVYMTTTLSIGGMDLTNMIAKNFSLSFDEAEKIKHKYSLDQGSEAKNIFPAILNGISVLRDEINKQYMYWETHNDNNKEHEKIDRVILCGGDANLAGLADYLELSMKMKVENANVWVNILDTENSIPEMTFEESLSYATVIGLSLGSYLYKSQPVINVLPSDEKKNLHKEFRMRFSTMILNITTLTFIIATMLLFPSYFLSKSKENLVESELEIFNNENPDISSDNIDKITGDINLKLATLNNAEVPYQVNDKVLGNLLSTRTAGITFSQIIFRKKTADLNSPATLDVYGTATNRDSLRAFKTALDNNPNFSTVNLPISDFLEKTNLSFTISITMK